MPSRHIENVEVVETIDIETSGSAVKLELDGRDVVDIAVRGDGAATFEIDIQAQDGTWFNAVGPSYSGAASYSDTIRTGAEVIRLRCTSGTATTGDTANVLLSAGGV